MTGEGRSLPRFCTNPRRPKWGQLPTGVLRKRHNECLPDPGTSARLQRVRTGIQHAGASYTWPASSSQDGTCPGGHSGRRPTTTATPGIEGPSSLSSTPLIGTMIRSAREAALLRLLAMGGRCTRTEDAAFAAVTRRAEQQRVTKRGGEEEAVAPQEGGGKEAAGTRVAPGHADGVPPDAGQGPG